ncbi:interleukin-27 subunit beta isoform X2 [Xenopus laevis]|uniref:Interleukin-27 subunit beta isoform X2 n=2 Tax=Xenopus laevis TaxID=8355 RepID=A0A1L8HN04_XENLA|nr:interleukin-27 subunit beta isoform X2 [Xenopus laevis]XP_041435783.1 interleukin-27 subunit beta isoform X2 [Xenopus laevis]OCT97445.1 hypothetical protein XELAEV_18009669mg [Xenopus laevis]
MGITLIFTALLVLYLNGSMEAESSGKMGLHPVRQQYQQIETDVVLHCDTLSDMEWRLNGKKIHHNKENLSKTHLTLLQVHKDQEGIYTCHDIHSNQTLTEIELHMGFPPMNLTSRCWATSYPEQIQCTWNLHHDTQLNTTFITTYRLGLSEPDSQCEQSKLHPNSCIISDFQMFAEVPYLLNVTAKNPLGSITHLLPFIVEDIIRPDPPENVRISIITGESRKLLLRWDPPHSWPLPEMFPLKYLIRYKRVGAKYYKTIGPYEQSYFYLPVTQLRSVIQAQVAAKDFTDFGEISEWSMEATGSLLGLS